MKRPMFQCGICSRGRFTSDRAVVQHSRDAHPGMGSIIKPKPPKPPPEPNEISEMWREHHAEQAEKRSDNRTESALRNNAWK